MRAWTLRGIVVAGIALTLHSCTDSGNSPPPPERDKFPGAWIDLGPTGVPVSRIVVSHTNLYVCSAEMGLWKGGINDTSSWRQIALPDTALGGGGVVTDIDVLGDTLFVSIFHYDRLNRTNRCGLWRSPNSGITWLPADYGIRTADQPYSSLWSVKRSPFDSNVLVATVGTTFRSEDGGQTWVQVTPWSGYQETFPVRIYWNRARAGEVWIGGALSGLYEPLFFWSQTGGASWEFPWIGMDFGGEGTIWGIAFDASAASTVYLASSYGVARSFESGQDWLHLNGHPPPFLLTAGYAQGYVGVVTHPSRTAEAYFVVRDTLYLSDDNGSTTTGKVPPHASQVISMDYVEPYDMVTLGTHSGVVGYRIDR